MPKVALVYLTVTSRASRVGRKCYRCGWTGGTNNFGAEVRAPADTLTPVVSLDATLQGLQLASEIDVTGQVSDTNLDYWRLEIVPLAANLRSHSEL